MSQELTKSEIVELEGIKIKRDQIDLIKRTIFPNATDDELRLFFYECARRGTHPLDRLIFPVARNDNSGGRRVTFQTGIDYLRAAAEETGRYVGQKSVQYGPPIKQKTGEDQIDVPEWAEVIVLRKDPETGEINEIPSRAFWKEFYPGEKLGFMWRKMPNLMLAKCAEAGALRKGFPRKLGGLYINEEMEQAEAVPFGSSVSRPALKEPEKKSNGQSQAETSPTITPVEDVQVQQGTFKEGEKKGQKWTMYVVVGGDKIPYRTFSQTLGDLATKERGSGLPMKIEWKQGKYSREIVTMESAERDPGAEG
jgi:phage recombination protein Bet